MWKSWSFAFVFWLAAALSAWSSMAGSNFRPFDAKLDLSRQSDAAALGPEWEVVPKIKWPGVVEVFDRGRPAAIRFELPAAAAYQIRLKLLFQSPLAKVSPFLNGAPLEQWTPGKIGEAQRRTFLLPGSMFHAGVNVISFQNSGPARSVLYEQVRVRNFVSVLMKHRIYLIPGSRFAMIFPPVGVLGMLVLFGIAALGLACATAFFGKWQLARSVAWGTKAWWMTGALLLLPACVAGLSPYSLASDRRGFLAVVAAAWGAGQLPLLCALALRRLGMILWRDLPRRILTGRILTGRILSPPALLMKTIPALCRFLLQTARAGWIWFFSHRHSRAYLFYSLVFLGLGGAFYGLGIKPAAQGLGNLSVCFAAIAAFLELAY
ncbi:MAG: hypothetical protein HY594_02195 [Candidatus Omnitrophica bacterium]|nr:hypothetical protein [Candidatus Omnitrophota bacterium]